MLRAELKAKLEEYWYDNQYLQAKAKEIEHNRKLVGSSENSGFFSNTQRFDEEELSKIFEKKIYIETLLQNLTQPYRTIMYLKYITFLTFDQIADKMNYSTKRIYQLHSEALEKLLTVVNSKKS